MHISNSERAASDGVTHPMKPSELTLADRIGRIEHALTAAELADLLNISRITIFKYAKTGRIPSFRVGTCVRFDPQLIATWLRKQ